MRKVKLVSNLSPIRLTTLFQDFFNSERAGGFILIACTLFSLGMTNWLPSSGYSDLWKFGVAGHSVQHWINDGLMAIFFLLIGLELEREIYAGELSDLRNAGLPIAAALGGMILPAALYISVTAGTPAQAGTGIPMATDIAFAIGILSLLGNRVPAALKIFLTALAVIDDLGAILIIAFFYTREISWTDLGIAGAIFTLLIGFNRMKIHWISLYIAGGIAMWYFMLHSGVHATLTGVLLAFAIPFGDGGEKSASYRLQHWLHRPVAFVVIPLFALANTCIPITGTWYEGLLGAGSLGIFLGLIIGKPLGITLFSYIGVKLKLFRLPAGTRWAHILGTGWLGGIGFTMSIFITLMAFGDQGMIDQSKIAVLCASAIAGLTGFLILRKTLTGPSGGPPET